MLPRPSPLKKTALVLGNGSYKPIGIDQCLHDASDILEALDRLNFEVVACLDGDVNMMDDAISRFHRRLATTPTDIAVIYYSGHGIQIDGVNYAQPIADSNVANLQESGLINLSEALKKTSKHANTTLVFLDACRTNPLLKRVNDQRESDAIAKGSGTFSRVPAGLAPVSEDQDMQNQTFIAYAAAPGEVAIADKTRRNSSFTDSLLAHMETTDLSLDNLMNRVASDVDQTGHGQKPWKISSLRSPFYFAPGSLVWFNTNIVGFIAYLISLLAYTWALSDTTDNRYALAAGGVMALSLFLFLFGLNRSYSVLRGDRTTDSGTIYRLTTIGGFFGGVIAGPLITAAYVFFWDVRWGDPPPTGEVLSEILLACVFCGSLLGPLGYNLARLSLFERVAGHNKLLANSLGGAAGGLITGVIAGPVVTWYFGSQERPFATPEVLYPGGLIGAMLTIFVILNYRLELFSYRRFISRLAACAVSVLVIAAATTIIFAFSYDFMLWLIDSVLGKFDVETLILAGLVAGPTVGLVLGAAVGLAYGLDKMFERARADRKAVKQAMELERARHHGPLIPSP